MGIIGALRMEGYASAALAVAPPVTIQTFATLV